MVEGLTFGRTQYGAQPQLTNEDGLVLLSCPDGLVWGGRDCDASEGHYCISEVQDGAVVTDILEMLVQDGFAMRLDSRYIISWGCLYDLLDDADLRPVITPLMIPSIADIRPVLKSRKTLSDIDFAIILSGWLDKEGKSIGDDYEINGGMIRITNSRYLLSRSAWSLTGALKKFYQRSNEERSFDANMQAWSRIRSDAVDIRADLSDFLQRTVVLAPESLAISLRKSELGDHLVEVIPSFSGDPGGWLKLFDRLPLQDHYECADSNGITHVVISPEVKNVLREIKGFKGRRLVGDRAIAFLHNPYGLLGPESANVVSPEAFERATMEAGISFSRFYARSVHAEDGSLDAFIVIDEMTDSGLNGAAYHFKDREDLSRFIRKVDERIAQEKLICLWEGYELEINGDTSHQLDILRQALKSYSQNEEYSHEDIYDLSQYSPRIEGIGTPKAIHSLRIPRKHDSVRWDQFDDAGYEALNLYKPVIAVDPELVQGDRGEIDLSDPSGYICGIDYSDPESGETKFLPLTNDELKLMASELSEARRVGRGEIDVLGLPTAVPVDNASDLLASFSNAINQAVKVKAVPVSKSARMCLIEKTNFIGLDYVEPGDVVKASVGLVFQPCEGLRDEIKLKEHQVFGANWLYLLWQNRSHGALLADDMGLGKTLQLLVFARYCLQATPGMEPILVVAPVSLLQNWQEEIDKFFKPGTFNVLTLYGSSLASFRVKETDIAQDLIEGRITKLLKRKWIGDADIVLTTYETLRDYEFALAREKWSIMICDESHKIKNPNALVTRAAKKMNVRFKVACTGTPVENTLTDLWCQFDFIQPGKLGSLNEFTKLYRRPIEAGTEEERLRVAELRQLIEPQILRREKCDVAKDLPQKITDDRCKSLPMSPVMVQLYSQAIADFRRDTEANKAGVHFKLLQQLKRICADPRTSALASQTDSFEVQMVNSPKLAWLHDLIRYVRSKNEKVIIFTDIREMQLQLKQFIRHYFGISPDIINGETSTLSSSSNSRQSRINAYQQIDGFNVIILSPLAVGFGVNIQAANHVVHYTRAWNPSVEDQASDRAYRIGQTRDVYVYCPVITSPDFITFDAKLDMLLDSKRELSADMLNGAGDISLDDFGGLGEMMG